MKPGLLLAAGFLGIAGAAFAKPPEQGAADAFAAVQAAYDPIAQMAAGPARTQRACADVGKLESTTKAVPTKAPLSAAIDPATWESDVHGLARSAEGLGKICNAPGQKWKDVSGTVRTVDWQLDLMKESVQGIAEDLKPRSLTPQMKAFDAPIRRAASDKKRKHVCKDMEEAAKSLDALEAVPAGVDKAKWGAAFGKIRGSFNDAKNFCDPKGDDGSVFDGAFDNVHDSFYQMVLLLPPAK